MTIDEEIARYEQSRDLAQARYDKLCTDAVKASFEHKDYIYGLANQSFIMFELYREFVCVLKKLRDGQ